MGKMMKHSPRGWNSWDCYLASVDEATVKKNADYMAAHLASAGYEYVVVDIQWSEPVPYERIYRPFTDLCMDEYGRLMPAETRFPSAANGAGFKPLADYVHGLGLKFGIHIMRGIPRQAVSKNCPILGTEYTAREAAKYASICAWQTDMYGVDTTKEAGKAYYKSIFELYASWGVDFIKVDDICRELPHCEQELIDLSDALHHCGRDIVLSLSPGPALLEKAELYKQVSNMWRITDDFWDQWELLYAMFERAEKWSIHTGMDHFPDADMLPVGALRQAFNPDERTHFTQDEQITMMTLWCIFRAPLMTGNELTKTDDFTLKLLTCPGFMEMHEQARDSHQVFRREIGGHEVVVWTAGRRDGGRYFAVFNLADEEAEITFALEELEIEAESIEACALWDEKQYIFRENVSLTLPAHGAEAFRI